MKNEKAIKTLTTSEATCGIIVWLLKMTQAQRSYYLSDVGHTNKFIKLFCDAHGIEETEEGWIKRLKPMPVLKYHVNGFKSREIIKGGHEFDPRTKLIYKPGTHHVIGQNVNGKIKWFDK